MKPMALLMIGMFALVAVPQAFGERTVLQPTAYQRVESGDQTGAVYLVDFTLPQELAEAKISRATLRYPADCEEDGQTFYLKAAPGPWQGAGVDWQWWTSAQEGLEDAPETHAYAEDCENKAAALEVAPWVRAWAGGATQYGFVLMCPDSGKIPALAEGEGVTLTVTYRLDPEAD
jgi:hypothetical protein